MVWASDQTGGRGQQGTVWNSEAGKNLTISVLKKFNALGTENQFYLNIAVSLAVYETLKALNIPEICVKWPNDIMSGSKKLCGILIENMVKARNISASVIGIGLNVNQEEFPGLPQATSMMNATGKSFDLIEVLYRLLEQLKIYLESLETVDFIKLKNSYQQGMYRINTLSRFKLADGTMVRGRNYRGRRIGQIKRTY